MAVRLERASMRLAVDPSCEPADDDEPGRGELAAEHPRDLSPIGRARPRPDDCDGRSREQLWICGASEVEARRRPVDRTQQWRQLASA
jgi:hypothetical protein